MNKFALLMVGTSFALLLSFTFFGGDYLLSNMRVAPAEIIGEIPPDSFEVEQALKTSEAKILVGIDRKNSLRLHIVKAKPIESKNALDLYQASKKHLSEKSKAGSSDFIVRYLSSMIDTRRYELAESIDSDSTGQKKLENVIFLTGPKESQIALWLDNNNLDQSVLYMGIHPKEKISLAQFSAAVKEIS